MMNSESPAQNKTANPLAKDPSWQRLPYAHLAIINASKLSPYALEPLRQPKQKNQKTNERTSWQTALAKWKLLPHSEVFEMPCVCLLPPKEKELEPKLAAALNPEELKRQGLHPVHLEDESELALLKAIKYAIELFYTDAFRPDPVVKTLQEYQKHWEQNPEQDEALAFSEEVALPLSMRYAQADAQQMLRPENFTSRQIHCYWLDGDAPLLSLELAQQLYRQHHRVAAELSFCDIYPQGLVPILFQAACLGRLWHLQQPDAKASGLLEIAQRDWNLFAAEPLLAEKDYRYLRLDLRAASKRQLLSLQNLYSHLSDLPDSIESPLETALEAALDVPSQFLPRTLEWIESSNLRTLPRYFPIQISALCPQTCSYCPYPKIQQTQSQAQTNGPNFMSRELWRHLLAEIVAFADDAVVNLSPLGEPMMHPEFLGFVEDLLQYPSLQLVIETSAVHWSLEDMQTLLRWNQREQRITWILGLDALDADLYHKLRPPAELRAGLQAKPSSSSESQQERAWALAELLLFSEQSLPRQVYLQAVRLDNNEQDLENFYRYWVEGKTDLAKSLFENSKWKNAKSVEAGEEAKAKAEPKPKVPAAQVIIQKYNSYAGFLPERQPVRLDPVERFPCRRLAREMVFDLQGRAFSCVQDLTGKAELGRFPETNLAELWQAGQALYQNHIEGTYPSLCQNCDEYYVYNF